jgi:hypothetical protein
VVVKGVVVDRLGGKAKVSAVSFEGSSAKGGSNELKLSRNSFNKQPPPAGGELQVLFAMKIDLGTSVVCKTLRREMGTVRARWGWLLIRAGRLCITGTPSRV